MAIGENSSVYDVLQKIGNEIVKEIQDEIEKNDLISSGRMLQAFDFGIKILDNRYIIRWDFSQDPQVENYVRYVINARKSGKQPPVEAIMSWMIHKGIPFENISNRRKKLLKNLKNKKVKKGLKQLSVEKKRRQRAFLIARAIGKKGTIKRFEYHGLDFLSPVRKGLVERIKDSLTKAFKKDFEGEIRLITQELGI